MSMPFILFLLRKETTEKETEMCERWKEKKAVELEYDAHTISPDKRFGK